MSLGKLLLVDDSTAVVESLTQTLVRLGVPAEDVLVARDGKSALASFARHKPSVVFLDMDLAGQRGDQVATRILEEAPATKVVIMTGMDVASPLVRAAVSAGAYEVIQKPLRLARIRQVLELIASEDRGLRRV